MRGGARKGAGRKRGPDKKTVTIKLGVSTITLLHELPKGSMSTFIEKALIAELRKAAIQKHSDQVGAAWALSATFGLEDLPDQTPRSLSEGELVRKAAFKQYANAIVTGHVSYLD